MRLADYIESSSRSETVEEAFAYYMKAAAELGFDRAMYSAIQAHPGSEALCIAQAYPEDWIGHYVQSGYVTLDPVRRYGRYYRTPFTWRDMERGARLNPIERKIMDEARDSGLFDGVAVPLHGPNGELTGVGLASSAPNPDAGRNLSHLAMITMQFHMVATLMTSTPSILPGHDANLTLREIEVLQWCAQGKSTWAISQILNISQSGVEFHLRNVYRKLEADNRITAVVKALYKGLISL